MEEERKMRRKEEEKEGERKGKRRKAYDKEKKGLDRKVEE